MDKDDKVNKSNGINNIKDNLKENIQNTIDLTESLTQKIHSSLSIGEESKSILIYEILKNLNNLSDNILSLQSNINSFNLDSNALTNMAILSENLANIRTNLNLFNSTSAHSNSTDNSSINISEIMTSLISCIDALNLTITPRQVPKPPLGIFTSPTDSDEPNTSNTPSPSTDPSSTPEKSSSEATISSNTISGLISKIATLLVDINSIRTELIRLFINLKEPIYFSNSVEPLLTTITQLSTTSYSLASSMDLLSKSIITHAKDSKLKDTIHLVYNINEDCEEVYQELKKRINILLKI